MQRKTVRLAVVLGGLALAVTLSQTPVALADDFICTGFAVGPFDNVIVPPGAFCNMTGAQVRGSVKVFGEIQVQASTIQGNITGEPGHLLVRIFGPATVIGGSVHIKGSQFLGSSGYAGGVVIGGNFQYEENRPFLFAVQGTIGGNLKAEKNTGGGVISTNSIQGDVECKENVPPIGESGNSVGGADKCPE